MNHLRERAQRPSPESSLPSMLVPINSDTPLPMIHYSDSMRGSANVHLPSLNELLPDLGKWQPEKAAQHSGQYIQGARGPRGFPGPPTIAPSPRMSGTGSDNYPARSIPASVSPVGTHPASSSPSRGRAMVTSAQSFDSRGLPSLRSRSSSQVQATELDQHGFSSSAASHSPRTGFYPSLAPPQDFTSPHITPPLAPPGYSVAGPSAYPLLSCEGLSDYGEGKKQGRRRGNLPKQVTDILRMWFQDHVAHPYPTEEEKQQLMHQTGLSISQISNWFINARRRSLPRMTGQGQSDTDLSNGHMNS